MTGPLLPVRRLTIPGEPMGKARARVTTHGTYTPKATRVATERLRAAWVDRFGHLPVDDGTARFGLRITFERNHRHRRDLDNMAKLVMDALNGAPGAYLDDHQVESLVLSTRWVGKGEGATVVALWALPVTVPPLQGVPPTA